MFYWLTWRGQKRKVFLPKHEPSMLYLLSSKTLLIIIFLLGEEDWPAVSQVSSYWESYASIEHWSRLSQSLLTSLTHLKKKNSVKGRIVILIRTRGDGGNLFTYFSMGKCQHLVINNPIKCWWLGLAWQPAHIPYCVCLCINRFASL